MCNSILCSHVWLHTLGLDGKGLVYIPNVLSGMRDGSKKCRRLAEGWVDYLVDNQSATRWNMILFGGFVWACASGSQPERRDTYEKFKEVTVGLNSEARGMKCKPHCWGLVIGTRPRQTGRDLGPIVGRH